jgi:alcohol dehydrogenase class IV
MMRLAQEQKRLQSLLKKHAPASPYVSKLSIQVGYRGAESFVKAMQPLGRRVLFCTGNRAMRNYGFLDTYLKLFKRHGFEVIHYDNISSNPTLKQMTAGLSIAKDFAPDFIYALGGGSVIDTAKVISAGLFGDIWDFVEKRKEITQAIPVVANATTSGTGSHVTSYAVITNTDTLEKKTLKHDLLLPKLSLVDLDIVQHMPTYTIATTGFDVLCHAAEVYTRNDCTAMAADFCTSALRLVREHLVASYHGDTLDNKIGMIFADIHAGIALALIGTHVPHAISHPISARFPDINHGQALAYVLAETSKRQIEKGDPVVNRRFYTVSRLLGGSSDFVRTASNYVTLLELGKKMHPFTAHDCELIYLDTMGYRRPSVERSPAKLSGQDVREIIHASLNNA